jgi:NAD(P)-dependent dehydrogenase (short-subunit alcohol dehydrogenase family)
MATHNSINTSVYPAIDPSNFENKLKGKVVLITGAGRGIGQGIAIAMAKAGATLSLLDLKKENLNSTVEQCGKLGATVLALECNVTDSTSVDAAIAEYTSRV